MKYPLIIFTLFLYIHVTAQNGSSFTFSNSGVTVNEIPPSWPGCEKHLTEKDISTCFDQKLSHHISEHFIVPYEIAEDEKNRTINVFIKITKKGKIKVRKIQGGSEAIKEIVQNTFASIPILIPGTLGGIKKDTLLTIPITF